MTHDHDEDEHDEHEGHDHGSSGEHNDGRMVTGPLPGMRVLAEGEDVEWLHPLTEPDWIAGATAALMQADDFVLGLVVEDVAYALPWWVMKNHHIANLTLGSTQLLIALCENCSSACAFDPVVDGRRLNFQVGGRFRGTFLTTDYETHSLWAPFTGECLFGALQGTWLTPLPLYQCTWQEWLELQPSTLVPSGVGESRLGHGADARPGTRERHMIREVELDRRLKATQLVFGVSTGGAACAYPLKELKKAGAVLNDTVGDEPVVVFSQRGTLLAIAFSRRLDGVLLSFESIQGARFRDRETGSEWDLTGRALDGPLAGKRLTYVPCAIEEWYAWAAAHRGTALFEG